MIFHQKMLKYGKDRAKKPNITNTAKLMRKGIFVPLFKKGEARDCAGCCSNNIKQNNKRKVEDRNRYHLRRITIWIKKRQNPTGSHIFTKTSNEENINQKGELHVCLINLDEAFDKIKRNDIWKNYSERLMKVGITI